MYSKIKWQPPTGEATERPRTPFDTLTSFLHGAKSKGEKSNNEAKQLARSGLPASMPPSVSQAWLQTIEYDLGVHNQ